MTVEETWDCMVVGGGAAGLSAALVLGRARRRTLVVDAGAQANLPAHGIGGLLGHDGRPPSELYALGRQELAGYSAVELREDRVLRATADEGVFHFELASGQSVAARRVILASGMSYRRPDIPGLEELWGDTVFHCPFCHGWEVQDRPLAMLGHGERAVHGALMLRGWSDDVKLLTNGPTGLDAGQEAKITEAGIAIDQRKVAELQSHNGRLTAVRFEDGDLLSREGMMVVAKMRPDGDLARQLGVELGTPSPMLEGAVKVDFAQKTSVPGVFAAGDIAGQSTSVAGAIAGGSMAAAQVVASFLVA